MLLLALFLIAGSMASAQVNLDAALIPKELMPYASAVVRYSNETVEVKDLNNVSHRVKKAITVLNKNGDGYGDIVIFYDKLFSIRSVKGVVYNADGKPIKKFTERDFRDYNAASDASLFEDSRVKQYKAGVIDYPCTVEYEYEIRAKQTMYFSDWTPSISSGMAVQKSSYQLICKPDFKIRYKESNLPQKCVEAVSPDGIKTYTWTAEKLKAVRREPYSPDPNKFLPWLKIAPEKFTYDGVSGGFSNWNELGKWVYDKLLTGRDVLPASTVEQIKDLTAEIADPKEKARKIYEFMQRKTRYISVQVGIGGFRPFTAAEVDQVNYGDCKALVNYTRALLKAAGIESYYSLVYGDRRKRSLTTDFASIEGNHIILCIPFKNDTTWLECTNQKMPFGFLGDFTDDRWALACTEQGGKLLHTPRYPAKINLTKREGKFSINASGELSGEMKTSFSGTEYDARYSFIDEPYKEQLKAIQDVYHINNLDVEKLVFTKNSGQQPTTTEQITIHARDFAANNGGKFYLTVNLANRLTGVPNEVRNRTTDVYINRGYVEEDHLSYTFPDGFKNEKFLLNNTIEKPFGKFSINMHYTGKELVMTRRLQINDGTYDKELYQDLVDFYQAVADADHYTATFKKE